MSSENSSQEKLQDINEKLQELERDSKKLPLQVLDIKEKLQELERDGKKSLFQVPGIEEKELELEKDSKKLLQFRHLKAESRVQDEMLNEVINSMLSRGMLSRGLAKNCIRFVSGDKKNISSEITLIPNEKSNPQIPIVLINLDGSTTPLEKMLAKY